MNSHGHHLPSHGALMWGGGQGAPQHPLAMMRMRIMGGSKGGGKGLVKAGLKENRGGGAEAGTDLLGGSSASAMPGKLKTIKSSGTIRSAGKRASRGMVLKKLGSSGANPTVAGSKVVTVTVMREPYLPTLPEE